jgi:hypothetical protein
MGAGIVLLASGGLAVYAFALPHNPIPADIRAGATYPLFYPAGLRAGWTLDKSSFYVSSGVVGYVIHGPSGNLNITIQPRPASFDFAGFYSKDLTGTIQFLTPLGQGAVGKTEGHYVGSLAAANSWVLASPNNDKVSQSDIQAILSDLKP